MIVVDTNVIAYLWIPGDRTPAAAALLARDEEWHAPRLWQSEFRNVLSTLIRAGRLPRERALLAASRAEKQMERREHFVETERVLDLSIRSGCSAYDCEFVALAVEFGVPLITADKRLAAAFPKVALHLDGLP